MPTLFHDAFVADKAQVGPGFVVDLAVSGAQFWADSATTSLIISEAGWQYPALMEPLTIPVPSVVAWVFVPPLINAPTRLPAAILAGTAFAPITPPAITLRWLPSVPDLLFRLEPFRTALQQAYAGPVKPPVPPVTVYHFISQPYPEPIRGVRAALQLEAFKPLVPITPPPPPHGGAHLPLRIRKAIRPRGG